MKLKINILTRLIDKPWGGGNQFLKTLKKEAIKRNEYDNADNADIVLFNGHHDLYSAIDLKSMYPKKIFIHRVDGPMDYRGKKGEHLDRKIFFVNNLVADGTVFQSEWSQKKTTKNFDIGEYEVIHNAPDPDIFYRKNLNKIKAQTRKRLKLVAVSWSDNPNKGFDVYHYLDRNLDHERYEMSFVGNTKSCFSKIQTFPPMNSTDLSAFLRSQDIFIFASKREACSNSLLEAIHCGLPCLVRDASSNNEVMGENGLLFSENNILEKLDQLSSDLPVYLKKIKVQSIEDIYEKYMNFFLKINQQNKPKYLNNKIINKIKLKFGFV